MSSLDIPRSNKGDGLIPNGTSSGGNNGGSTGSTGSTGTTGSSGNTGSGMTGTFPDRASPSGADGSAAPGNFPGGTFNPDGNGPRLLQQTFNFFNFIAWDWRGVKGALTPVRNQGKCGSCYAFAAVAAVESAVMISRGYWTIDLSEQQILDCTRGLGNLGCSGGYKDRSMFYAVTNGLVS